MLQNLDVWLPLLCKMLIVANVNEYSVFNP